MIPTGNKSKYGQPLFLCEECESRFFTQVCCVKKISALLAPSGVETRIPVYTLQCTSCGHINKDFLPPISS